MTRLPPLPLPLLLIIITLSCGRPSTPLAIAYNLDSCLKSKADDKGWTLAVRCTCVHDAMRLCLKIQQPASCAWDGWVDKDHDAMSVWACTQPSRLPDDLR